MMFYTAKARKRTVAPLIGLLCVLASLICAPTLRRARAGGEAQRSSVTKPNISLKPAEVREAYGKLPLSFELNAGQADAAVKYISRGEGYRLFLTATEAALVLNSHAGESVRPAQKSRARAVVRMKFAGAHANPQITATDELPGKVNYFVGSDPAKWRAGLPTYAKVRYSEVYPGIDLVYYGNQRRLEYDFIVSPGADARVIRLRFDGVRKVSRDAAGDLLLQTGVGVLRQQKPVVYQEVDGARREIAGEYVVARDNSVGFKLGAYDVSRPLVIDPVLVYSTYLGGGDNDVGYGIAVDAAGNAYVTGNTASDNFPTANPFQPARKGVNDIFVTKLNQSGTSLIYSTYLGGTYADSAAGIAVDDAGSAYVTGSTMSFDYPVTQGAYQTAKSGGVVNSDAFVTKLSPAGSALVYSTYLGGPDNDDRATGIRVDASRNAYVSGTTSRYGSGFFPVTPGAFQTTYGGGTTDAFASKLNGSGNKLLYSTYLGGADKDYGTGIAVDFEGSAYVVGETYSNNFPTTAGSFRAAKTDQPSDAFATKLNATGSALAYSTYLGGSVTDAANDVAVDTRRNAYIIGNTSSPDYPVTPGAFQPTIGKLCDGCATNDAFVTKLSATGRSLVYSTFLGGAAGNENGNGIAVDTGGNAYVAGSTNASDFPIIGGFQLQKKYGSDAFFGKFDAAGRLIASSFLGGRGSSDSATAISVDGGGNAYLTGGTNSRDFPITGGAFQTLFNRNDFGNAFDAFVSKIDASANSPFPSDGVITGHVITDRGEPLSGATVTLKGWSTATTTTDASGAYAFTNLQTGVSYTVEARKKSYRMEPWSQSISGLTGTQTADFTATLMILVISGHVRDDAGLPLSGVTMSLSGDQTGSTTTDANGFYSFTVIGEQNYTVTPSKSLYRFEPSQRQYIGYWDGELSGEDYKGTLVPIKVP